MAKKMAEGVYLCPKCEELKYEEEFGHSKGKGISGYCKACNLVQARERYRLQRAAIGKTVQPVRRLTVRERADNYADYVLGYVNIMERGALF